jgi:hypothetical protein
MKKIREKISPRGNLKLMFEKKSISKKRKKKKISPNNKDLVNKDSSFNEDINDIKKNRQRKVYFRFTFEDFIVC